MAIHQEFTPYLTGQYKDLSGYQPAFESIFNGGGFDQHQADVTNQRLTDLGGQFSSQFTNLVGRAPTKDELNQFFQQSAGGIIKNSPGGMPEGDSTNVRNQIVNYVGDNFNKAAQDFATQQLTDQQGQASSLADLFRTQGRQAISNTESGLLDYQQRLFERLRPNLITSLQAQGLLNTGGLNEALAGAQKDLGTAAQGALLDANLNNENQANAIAYGGAAAPYLFKQNAITQQPGYLQSTGADALNRAFQTYTQNLDFNNQMRLANFNSMLTKNSQPSFLRTLGQSTATSLGTSLGQWAGPGGAGQDKGQNVPPAAMLFA